MVALKLGAGGGLPPPDPLDGLEGLLEQAKCKAASININPKVKSLFSFN
jgi:hypothetical protein